MCDHGFDPNIDDYDHRAALMIASIKGNADVVKLLLQYSADPNITDMHGSSALLEATKNGHDDIVNLLFEHEASLCMPDSQAASVFCQAAFDGDILLIKRLLKAGININAADYNKRTASHIAAAEGNVAAIRILAERGADLSAVDQWGNTVRDEAARCNSHRLIEFLDAPFELIRGCGQFGGGGGDICPRSSSEEEGELSLGSGKFGTSGGAGKMLPGAVFQFDGRQLQDGAIWWQQWQCRGHCSSKEEKKLLNGKDVAQVVVLWYNT
ncbi:hypothetical protein HJC23_002645 [Cyclotella cryptica]|uniref:Uncharacterized protein n=1 Tax=Cyclotella cryptica TaxID=29204 RepID=A0ABD3PMD3_9STRA